MSHLALRELQWIDVFLPKKAGDRNTLWILALLSSQQAWPIKQGYDMTMSCTRGEDSE